MDGRCQMAMDLADELDGRWGETGEGGGEGQQLTN